MIDFALNALDQSAIVTDTNAAQAVRETVALAEYLDTLGYRRFWLAEHHNTSAFAGARAGNPYRAYCGAHAKPFHRLGRHYVAALCATESGRTISHVGQPIGRAH
jgi:alkanesulfonate monooxygenase SsuD/methylene tetrahydromethanopterin reductase-like flavin-dependent oxidoreductase (luciferase family)